MIGSLDSRKTLAKAAQNTLTYSPEYVNLSCNSTASFSFAFNELGCLGGVQVGHLTKEVEGYLKMYIHTHKQLPVRKDSSRSRKIINMRQKQLK